MKKRTWMIGMLAGSLALPAAAAAEEAGGGFIDSVAKVNDAPAALFASYAFICASAQ